MNKDFFALSLCVCALQNLNINVHLKASNFDEERDVKSMLNEN